MSSVLVISISLLSSTAIIACSSNNDRAPASGAQQGSRTYKLDPESGGIRVSVYGVFMGTPDAGKLELLLASLKSSGEFSSLAEEAVGIEGGFTKCGQFSESADRTVIYELLRSIETDPKETHFSAVSVSGCGSQNP